MLAYTQNVGLAPNIGVADSVARYILLKRGLDTLGVTNSKSGDRKPLPLTKRGYKSSGMELL